MLSINTENVCKNACSHMRRINIIWYFLFIFTASVNVLLSFSCCTVSVNTGATVQGQKTTTWCAAVQQQRKGCALRKSSKKSLIKTKTQII